MRARKEKTIFRGLTIAATGDLTAGRSGQWIDTNITRWVELREGKFVRPANVAEMERLFEKENEDGSEGVTHLVCSEEEFKRRGSIVQAALKRRACHLVTLDWLENSMQGRKRLPEEPYSHRRTLREERVRERRRLAVVKGLEKAVKEVNPNLYHLYCDHTFFQYEVVMTRDVQEGEEVRRQRYVLSIFESHNKKPHLYWFVAKYYKMKGDPQPKIYRPSHAPGVFAREFSQFESFFQIKTGIPWAQRLVRAGTTAQNCFQYQAPTGGKPVGWIPAEYIPVEVSEVVMTDEAVNTVTVTPPATATDTNDNDKGRVNDEAKTTVSKLSDTPVAPQPLITPANSPQHGLATAPDPSPREAT